MSEHDQPSDELAPYPRPADPTGPYPRPADPTGPRPKPADPTGPRPKPAADRPAAGRSYFPASPITPGRWNPADLRIRRATRRSP